MTNRPKGTPAPGIGGFPPVLWDLVAEDRIDDFAVAWLKWIDQQERELQGECGADDHLYLLILAASVLPGGLHPGSVPTPEKCNPDGSAKPLIQRAGERLHSVNPTLSETAWGKLYHLIVGERFGGQRVYFKSHPRRQIENDARRPLMTFERLQALHPEKSRGYLYKVLKEARRKK